VAPLPLPHDPTPLLVIHPDPVALSARIRPEARARLTVAPATREHGPGTDVRSERVGGLARDERTDLAILRFPLDGPLASIVAALRGLRARLQGHRIPWIVLQNTDGYPPSRSVLDLVRGHGLRPGVDLTTIDWVRPNSIVWADGDTAREVTIRIGQAAPAASIASVLPALRGFDPDAALAVSLLRLAQSGLPMSDEQWTLALQAHYLEGTALPADLPFAGGRAAT
jgi:hypothetical protein